MIKLKHVIVIIISAGWVLWFLLPILHHGFHGWLNALFLREPYTLTVWFEPRFESVMTRWYLFGALQGLLFALFIFILSLIVFKTTKRAETPKS